MENQIQNFEIKFELEVRVGPREHREGGLFRRVISAQNLDIARKIAEAMLGEEVFRWQYLSKVSSVEQTKEKSPISSFCSEHYTWERVLQGLGLWGTGTFKQVVHHKKDDMPITSGFFFSPDQAEHVLTCDLRP